MKNNLIWGITVLILLAGCNLPGNPAETDATELPAVATLPPPSLTTDATPQPPSLTLDAESLVSMPVGIHIQEVGDSQRLSMVGHTTDMWTHFGAIYWDKIEAQSSIPSTFDWEVVGDDRLVQLSSAGYRVIGIVRFAPDWAQKYPGVFCGPVSEEALDRYAQFLNQLVSRYSQPPYNVHYWELGNEPDVSRESVQPRKVFGCWGETGDPFYGGGYYAEMLKRAYPQIKAADPESKVVIGGLLLDCDPNSPPETEPGSGQLKDCSPSKFLEGIISNGGGDYFDGVAFHSYDYYLNEAGKYANGNWHSSSDTTGPVLIAKARFIRDILNNYGYPEKLLLNTELALLCGRSGDEPECQSDTYQATKAAYLAQANAAALAEGLLVNLWYSLEGWRGSGLVDDQVRPLAGLDAFNFSAGMLNGASFIREIMDIPSVRGYEFVNEGRSYWVIWSADAETQTVQLPVVPVKIFNVFGEEMPVSQEILLDYSPVYIEWNP